MNRETPLKKAIVKALNATGAVTVWSIPSGRAKGGRIRMAPTGTPDVIGFSRYGRHVGIEVKLPGGVVSEEQLETLKRMVAAGCLAGVARSVEDALRIVEVLR